MSRRLFGFAMILAALTTVGAGAANWPTSPVSIIVPFPAGGSTDTAARIIAAALSERIGQPFVIDNRGGAGGVIGTALAARASHDGYTLLLGSTSTLAIAPAVHSKIDYDPENSFAPIGLISRSPLVLAVRPTFPVRTVQDLVLLAKERPGRLNFGSAGLGTSAHLTMEMFRTAANIDVEHVPYRGGALALADLLAGRIDCVFDTIQLLLPSIVEGKLRPLAVTGRSRHPLLPDIPAMAEAPGYEEFEAELWFGLLAPAGTPEPILERLHSVIVDAVRSPEIDQLFRSRGIDPAVETRADFARLIARETHKWGEAAAAFGAQLN